MSQLVIRAGDVTFDAIFEDQSAPKNQLAKTCAAFRRAMPSESQMVHFIMLTSGLDRLAGAL